jgi:hypothetical protein
MADKVISIDVIDHCGTAYDVMAVAEINGVNVTRPVIISRELLDDRPMLDEVVLNMLRNDTNA